MAVLLVVVLVKEGGIQNGSSKVSLAIDASLLLLTLASTKALWFAGTSNVAKLQQLLVLVDPVGL